MGNLENELLEMLQIFNSCQLSEKTQREIITTGVYFEFSKTDRVLLDCFRFAKLLNICQDVFGEFDANQIFRDLFERNDAKYESLIKSMLEKEKEDEKIEQLIKR